MTKLSLLGHGSSTNPGGKIDLFNTDQTETISILGHGNFSGGEINVKNENGTSRVRILSKFNNSLNGGVVELFNENDEKTIFINASDAQKGARVILRDSLANQRITLDANHDNTGDARIITDEIEIKGGSDLAELFDITDDKESISPGMLVSIDPDHPGKLMLSNKAYDQKLAGIVSGANGIKPGILMGQESTIATGENLVTLSGRTYVYANRTGGAIKAGDFITSSDVPGEAMKAKKGKKARGAIIGKAMTNLDSEKGFILVLVNLQ